MTAEADAAAGGARPATAKKLPVTKRQKRKAKNEKNTWSYIQHPKIQSMEHREKLYVKDSGLKKSKTTQQQQPLDPSQNLMSSQELKFGRLLAAPEPRQRHKAVLKLKSYLTARSASDKGLSELDLLKLWKALWYTLYMADKQAVQYELSNHLAQLIWCVAGTPEEDEYAAGVYLQMTMAEEEEEEDSYDEAEEEDGCGHDECDHEHDQDEDDHVDEDEEEEDDDNLVTLEEIENTLDQDGTSDDDDNSSSSDSDEDAKIKDGEGGVDEQDEEMEPEDQNVEDEDPQQIPHCRGAHLASLFLRTFFHTIRRDWDTMDKYRVDKFYTLMRLMMHQVFKYMAERHWNYGIIRLFNDVVFDEVLNQRPNGLRYHLIDLTMDELAHVSVKAPFPLTEATFLDVLEPYFGMCQTGLDDDTLQTRVTEKIVEKFLDQYSIVSENAMQREKDDGDKNDDANAPPILDQVHVGTVAEFLFGMASDPATKDKHRKSLYDMHKKFMRRLKQVGKDVELGPGSEGDDDDDDDFEMLQDDTQDAETLPREDVENEAKRAKKNRSEKKSVKKAKYDEDDVKNTEQERETVEKPSKKKRKRKKNKASAEGSADNVNETTQKQQQQSSVDKEEEVVISLSEQQAAKKAGEEKKKKSGSKRKQAEAKTSSAKKVKFDKVNRSKSHKASMKALVTANPPKTKDRTPEKGILRTPKHSPGNVLSKSKRKKAVNYF